MAPSNLASLCVVSSLLTVVGCSCENEMRDVGAADARTADARAADASAVRDQTLLPGDGAVFGTDAVACGNDIDIVFAIDVSTSMVDEIAKVREGMTAIWNATEQLSDNPQFSLVVFVDSVLLVNDCAPFVSLGELQSELDEWETFTESNLQPGTEEDTNRECIENALDALNGAGTSCPWREKTDRFIILATDDGFAESPEELSVGMNGRTSQGFSVESSYPQVLQRLDQNDIRLGAFTESAAQSTCNVGATDDPGDGYHAEYMGQTPLTEVTDGRAWSIAEVRAGELDMAQAIADLVEQKYCQPILR